MVLKPVSMEKIAIIGLRKNRQSAISILHDLEVLQIEPLSKDVSSQLRNERDNELTRKVSDQLLRIRALLTVVPSLPVESNKGFESVDKVLEFADSIKIDEQVATLEKDKEALLTTIRETENNIKLVEKFNFFPENLNVLQLQNTSSYFGSIDLKKFEEDQFNELHKLVTTEFLKRIKSGEATTQDLKAACDWLAKNDISGVAFDGNSLDKLANIMPTVDPELVQRRLYGSKL